VTAVVICNWRDLQHPEAGGSEHTVEAVARILAADGHPVTILCAKVAGRPADETRDGVRYLRAGGRFGVYPGAAWALLRRQVRPDVVIDVQNGLPWLSRLVTRKPVVVLLHHVHREQWQIIFGTLGSLGWLIESRVAPWVYRRSRYLTVSECTRAELAGQRIDPARVTVAYNGTPAPLPSATARSVTPRVVVLGRLVPHKRVEIVIRAAAALRERFPDLAVDVVGQGWWADELAALARRLGVEDVVTFHGFVDEQAKADLLAKAWIGALPSVKEGWGLSVVEAASHGTPSVAFSSAGGLAESILDDQTGMLVDGDEDAYIAALADLLADRERCAVLGRQARAYAAEFSWDVTAATVAQVLAEVTGPTRHPIAATENAGIAGLLQRAVSQPATATPATP
jgi:glycosyltransferase involved in cell wall biosynthesis